MSVHTTFAVHSWTASSIRCTPEYRLTRCQRIAGALGMTPNIATEQCGWKSDSGESHFRRTVQTQPHQAIPASVSEHPDADADPDLALKVSHRTPLMQSSLALAAGFLLSR